MEIPRPGAVEGHGREGLNVQTANPVKTNGGPVTIRKTGLFQFYWQCFTLRDQEWQARDLGATWMVVLRDNQRRDTARQGPLRRLANWGGPMADVYPTGPGLLLDYRAPAAELLAIIIQERPAYLVTFPSLLRELLRESEASGRRPPGMRWKSAWSSAGR